MSSFNSNSNNTSSSSSNANSSMTGRSPYPTRSRRRQQQQQLQQQQQTHADDNANVASRLPGNAAAAAAAMASPMMTTTSSNNSTNATTPSPAIHSATTTATATTATTTPTSGYMMGQGLVQARISPMNPSSASQNTSSNRRRFFAPNNPTTSSRLSSSASGPSTSQSIGSSSNNHNNMDPSNSNAAAPSSSPPPPQLIMHGINITHLRSLTQSCLGTSNVGMAATASSPSMAVFFASIIYSKTKEWTDAFVYAQALVQNGQHKRAVQWIHQVGLLQCSDCKKWKNSNSTTCDATGDNNIVSSLALLQLESLLLAANALSFLNDWNALVNLLEETQYYTSVVDVAAAGYSRPPMLSSAPLDDDDDIAWQLLAGAIAKINMDTQTCTHSTVIHPLARICFLRGKGYSELGHPLRAAKYWNKALQMDPLCVDALEGLLDKSVVEPAATLQTVLALDFTTTGTAVACTSSTNLEWLRALYLARVHVAAPTGGSVQEGTTAEAALVTSMSMEHHGMAPTAATGRMPGSSNPQDVDDSEDVLHDEENEPMDANTATVPPLQQHGTTAASIIAAAQQRSNTNTNNNANRQSTGSTSSFANPTTDNTFWNDSSSIQLLTPIPQQPSVADMSSASSGLFFGNTSGIAGRTSLGGASTANQNEHTNPIFRLATTAKNSNSEAEAALAVLWNKHQLHHAPEILAMAAQQAFSKYDWKNALTYCQALRKMDPLSQNSNKAAFCHVSTLVQLRQKRSLFRLAHEWVEAAPKEARSWFAVGAYYYVCERYHIAQRHFCRATRLDPQCAEAWIAFGTSFAACDESDQALASFRAAQRLAPGNHVSLLYIGMEYLRTNHLVLAQHFLSAANDSANGTDALAKSELGVLYMYQKKYDQAIAWFLQALGCSIEQLRESAAQQELQNSKAMVDLDTLSSLIQEVQDEYWEPTLFNLAHAYRKERLYEHAIECLERCLALKESSSAYSALAFCMHLDAMSLPLTRKDETNQLLHGAIDTYHQALAKKPDAAFSSEMLAKALGDALEQTDFFVSNQENDAADTNVSGTSAGVASTPSKHMMSGRPSHASSIWTDDGLSLSQESASDIDMS